MKPLALACLLFCLASVPGGIPLEVAEGSPRTRNGRIAFSAINLAVDSPCGPYLDTDLFTVLPNGAGLTRITEGSDYDGGPAWAPDGQTLAFWRGAPLSTVFTPVGTTASTHLTPTDIWVLDPVTGARNLTNTPESFEFSPDWSPDADQIAFDSDRGAGMDLSLSRGHGLSFDIYVMKSDGTEQRSLVEAPGDQVDAAWSPDGKWIAYGDHSPGRIGLVDRRGRPVRTIDVPENRPRDPDWSPDGSQIAFGMSGDIWITNLHGDMRNLTSAFVGNSIDSGPSWSRDGKRIAFLSNREGGDYRLYTMDSDGRNARPLIDLELTCGSSLSPPSWGSQ
ncbi:MAG: TolB family protein [Actinomycetota bacterium]